MFLLDTNTVIYFFKGQGQVAEKLLGTRPAEIALSTISAQRNVVSVTEPGR